ncbi:MAG: hypothetical protein K1X72_21625 [Pyrinomonadaceae bacterium]|nr:hypothetical protein [Pyrinomonadaceae bacterium]
MSRIGTFFLGSLIGAVIGGVLVFYFFVGAPRNGKLPGIPIQPPESNLPATAQIVLKQEFFNEVLNSIFRDMNPPSFPLGEGENSAQPGQCPSQITLLPESGGVRSSLSFENNKIMAPLAFRGSYNSIFGCVNFSGWAQTNLEMRFDADQQIVFGQLNVETVNLDGVNPLLSGIITPLVQSTLNQRVNPIQILDGKQLALKLPMKASEANLKANVKDVRSEVKDNVLYLYLVYEFSGEAMNKP